MKNIDSILLLLVGLCFAGFAELFWSNAGENAFSLLSTLVIVVLLYDNHKLRNKLK